MSSKKGKKDDILHHHLIARIELEKCPGKNDLAKTKQLLKTIGTDIQMKPLSEPLMFYVSSKEKEKVGMSGIMPIQTSHISMHFWTYPNPHILHSKKSKCLLQFDLYTCGALNKTEIKTILRAFDKFCPTRANITLLNRKWGMKIDSLVEWDCKSGKKKWTDFINNY